VLLFWEVVYHGVSRRLRSGQAPKQRKAKLGKTIKGFLCASVSSCENAFEILTSAADVALAKT
jgi:hypothetical protein